MPFHVIMLLALSLFFTVKLENLPFFISDLTRFSEYPLHETGIYFLLNSPKFFLELYKLLLQRVCI